MIESPILEVNFIQATAGEIAVTNLESARQQAWSRFWQSPRREGIAEYIVEQEQMTAQFLGDFRAFDRLDALVEQFVHLGEEPSRTGLIRAQIAAGTHRFNKARGYLKDVQAYGTLAEAASRLQLSIDQACGDELHAVLKSRRLLAAESGRLEDLVPLGALLADLGEFNEADHTYLQALMAYQNVSPFPLAWVCFQLGSLWGELVPEPQSARAEKWYRKAIDYVPAYVKARVHLSEILSGDGRFEDAEALLSPVASSGDPEVNWRLADVMVATGDLPAADVQMQSARSGFEYLLEKHPLAFADHGAEFYSGSGNDAGRAFELARINLQNRPTLRAFEQAYETAMESGQSDAAEEILASAKQRWGTTLAFKSSPLRVHRRECSTSNRSGSEQSHDVQS
jgi:tetratricopeptide (TPR) repeat protein